MDLRTKKTRQSIFNAFLELRARCPLEKITVKELCAKAVIHKSTFYAHYQDLYDLADTLETEVVDQVLDSIQNPEYALERPAEFIRERFGPITPGTPSSRPCSPAAGAASLLKRPRPA